MGKLRGFLGVVAVLALAGAATLTTLRLVDTSSRLPAMATAFASYAVVGYLVAFLLLLLVVRRAGRARRLVAAGIVLALVGLVAHGYWLAPQVVGGHGTRTDLTVMTSNLRFGTGDADTVVRTAADRKVDVLVLEEVTPIELAALDRAGLADLLPNRSGRPYTTASGTMVFSRWRLTAPSPVLVTNGGVAVDVGAPKPFRLLAVHTAQPVTSAASWHHDLLEVEVRAAAAVDHGPTLVVGDFNATRDHLRFRSILGVGLRDAAEQANSGWQPTWPTGSRAWYLRPLIAIDHVLVSPQFAAVDTHTVDVQGTDHRALVVDLERR